MSQTSTTSLVLLCLVSMSACQGDINKVGTMPGSGGAAAGGNQASTKAVGSSAGTVGLGGSGTGGAKSGPTGGYVGTSVASGGVVATGGSSASSVASGGVVATGGVAATGGTGGTGGQAGSHAMGGTGGFSTKVADGVFYAAYYDIWTDGITTRESLTVVKNDTNLNICVSVLVSSDPPTGYRVTMTAPGGWGGGDGQLGMAPGVCEVLQERIPVYSAASGSGQLNWEGTKPCVVDVDATLNFPVDPAVGNPASESLSVRGLIVNGC